MVLVWAIVTNVDFDPKRFDGLIRRCVGLRESLKEKVCAAGGKVDFTEAAATFQPAATLEGLNVLVKTFDIKSITTVDEDLKAILG